MEEILTKEELNETKGGARISALAIGVIIFGVVSFITGIVNGYQRPLTCGSSK